MKFRGTNRHQQSVLKENPMKNWIIVICLLFTSSAFAELTPEDILTISDIVEKSEERMRAYIDKSEKQTREYVDTKLESLEHKLDGRIGRLEGRLNGTDRNITIVVALVVGVMALIVLAVGIPQLILVSRQNNQNAMQKELEAMRAEMQQLRKELALLLQDR